MRVTYQPAGAAFAPFVAVEGFFITQGRFSEARNVAGVSFFAPADVRLDLGYMWRPRRTETEWTAVTTKGDAACEDCHHDRPFAGGALTAEVRLVLAAPGQPITSSVTYERVEHPTSLEEPGGGAVVEGAVELAAGVLPSEP